MDVSRMTSVMHVSNWHLIEIIDLKWSTYGAGHSDQGPDVALPTVKKWHTRKYLLFPLQSYNFALAFDFILVLALALFFVRMIEYCEHHSAVWGMELTILNEYFTGRFATGSKNQM